METVWQDIRFGMRVLAKKPGFALVVVATLALGIGANTAVFSVVNAVLLRPLPVRDVDRMVFPLPMQGPDPFGVSAIDFEAWQAAGLRSFESMAIGVLHSHNVTGEGEPERVVTTSVAPNFFPTLGVAPVIGRNFSAEEARGSVMAPVAILGLGLWQRRYGGDPGILGRSIRLDGHDHTIVGVMPAGFDLPLQTQLWTSFSLDTVPVNQRAVRRHTVVARLRPGVALEQAELELKAVAAGLEQEQPNTHAGWTVKLLPMRRGLLDDFEGNIRAGLLTLLAGVGFLLLIACSNVANLLLGRSLARSHEIAIRVSLGAGRWRLLRQLLTETTLLLIAGSAAGVLVSAWVTPLVLRGSPVRTSALASHLLTVSMDDRVLGFSMAATALTGVLFGLMPAWRASRVDPARQLREKNNRGSSGAETRRLMSVSVATQIALALVLLVSAGVMVGSFRRLQQVELGFRSAGVMSLEMNFPAQQYTQLGQRVAFVESLLERVRALPGVRAAGVVTNTPLAHFTFDAVYQCEGRPPASQSEVLLTADRLVTRGYLETIGVRVLRGRTIGSQDRTQGEPAVVVSEELARTCWPGAEALGRRVRRISRLLPDAPWMTIVGVVENVREDRAAFRRDRAVWYVPFAQVDLRRQIHLVVRSEGNPLTLAGAIRREVAALDPNQPVAAPVMMTEQVSELVNPDRFAAFVMLAFSLVGLFLATIGIFGLVSYVTSQRTKEIGIRIAFGAQPRDILGMVLGQGLRLGLAGIALGIVGAGVTTRLISGFVYQAEPLPLLPIVAVAVVLLLVTLAACLTPARRATKVDPLAALRYE